MDTQSQIDALAAKIDAFNQSSTITRDQETALRERLGLNTTATTINYTGLVRFGGDGTDGVLTLTSGTTTIDLGGVAVFEKNYTSISVTGTAAIAFSNPHANGTLIDLKSQGDVTITSSANPTIDLTGLGGAGGGAASNNSGIAGNSGNTSLLATPGGGAGLGTIAGSSTGGTGATALFNGGLFLSFFKSGVLFTGSGGGSGGAGLTVSGSGGGGGGGGSLVNNGVIGGTADAGVRNQNGSSGAGGRGAGGLMIECAGALNVTSIFAASGNTGSVASGTGSNGGGGGGGGGSVVILYTTLTANTGTYTVTGGAGGLGSGSAGGTGGTGGVGGAGSSLVTKYYA